MSCGRFTDGAINRFNRISRINHSTDVFRIMLGDRVLSPFGAPTVATTILYRLLHHCTPITIMGDSYRIKASLQSKLLEKTREGQNTRLNSPPFLLLIQEMGISSKPEGYCFQQFQLCITFELFNIMVI